MTPLSALANKVFKTGLKNVDLLYESQSFQENCNLSFNY